MRRVKEDMTIEAEIREQGWGCPAGFEDRRRGHKPRTAGVSRRKEAKSHVWAPDETQPYQTLDFSPVSLIQGFLAHTVR